jgi:hypothetical protein
MVQQLTKPNLDNLFKNGHLKQEPCDQEEFDLAHQKRNLAEYEGYLEIEESTIKELRDLTSSLMRDVEKLVKMK